MRPTALTSALSRFGLRYKLAAFVAALIFVITIMQLGQNHTNRAQRAELTREHTHVEAIAVSEAIRWSINHIWMLQDLIGKVAVAHPDQITSDFLKSQIDGYSLIVNMLWLLPNGDVSASALPQSAVNLGTREHISSIMSGSSTAVSPVLPDTERGHFVFAVCKGIYDGHILQGILVVYVDLAKLPQIMPLHREPNGTTVLIDPNGMIITDKGITLSRSPFTKDDPIYAALANPKATEVALNFPDDRKLVGTVSPIKGTGWAAYVGVSDQHLRSSLLQNDIQDILTLLLIGALSIFSAMFIIDRMLRRLRELRKAALAVADGDHNIRVRIRGNDELAEVAWAFNQMLGQIDKLETERLHFFTASPDLIVVSDHKGILRDVNPAWNQLHYSREELLGQSYLELLHPDDVDSTYASIKGVWGSADAVTWENRLRCSNGEYKWMLWNGVTMEKYDSILAIGRDITNRKISEQLRAELLAQEQASRAEAEAGQQRFAFLAKASAQLSTSLDYEQNLKNLAQLIVPDMADWCEINVVKDGDTLQQVALTYLPSVADKSVIESLKAYPWHITDLHGPGHVIRTQRPELLSEVNDMHLQTVARNHEHLALLRRLPIVSVISVPLIVRNRTFGAMTFARTQSTMPLDQKDLQFATELANRAAIAFDNSQLYLEARVAEQRLSQQLDFTQAFANNMAEGICAIDVDGNLIFINPAAEQILCRFGYTATELFAISPQVNTHDQHQHLTSTCDDGTVIYAIYKSSPIHVEGKYAGSVLVIEDVTQKIEAEAAVRAAEEERDLSRMRFLQVSAHELRNPMAGIKGILSLLRRRQKAGRPLTDIQSMFDAMEHEVDRLSALLTQILEAFRAQEGKLKVELNTIDLGEVIRTTLNPFFAADENCRFVLHGVDDLVWVQGDANRLEDVFRNLLGNAVKYSPPETAVQIGLRVEDSHAEVTVTDKGLGIPKDQLNRVFEGFFRASNLAGRDPGGIGLGLYICRDIVQRHGGTIWVESQEGAGATFHVRLPLAKVECPHIA